MKLVGESSLHNKKKDEQIRIMMKLREKKDYEEKCRIEQKKKEDAERLEEYYISLKNMESAQTLQTEEVQNDNKDIFVVNMNVKTNTTTNQNASKLRRSFFTTDLVDF